MINAGKVLYNQSVKFTKDFRVYDFIGHLFYDY